MPVAKGCILGSLFVWIQIADIERFVRDEQALDILILSSVDHRHTLLEPHEAPLFKIADIRMQRSLEDVHAVRA